MSEPLNPPVSSSMATTSAASNNNLHGDAEYTPNHKLGWSETHLGASIVNFFIYTIPLAINIILVEEDNSWIKNEHPIGVAAVIFFGVNFILYLWSRVIDRCWTVDLFWSVIPFILCWSYMIHPDAVDGNRARQAVVTSLVFVWGVRLSLNFLSHGPVGQEDFRYIQMRAQFKQHFWWISYFSVFSGQALFLFAGTLSLYPALTESTRFAHNALDIIAIIIGFGSVALETIADLQMAAHRKGPNKQQVMKSGVWRISRHPNYLGEFGFWCSLSLFAIGARETAVWTIAGPILLFLMIRFASVPLMEKRQLERKPEYAEYMKETSAMCPMPQCFNI